MMFYVIFAYKLQNYTISLKRQNIGGKKVVATGELEGFVLNFVVFAGKVPVL